MQKPSVKTKQSETNSTFKKIISHDTLSIILRIQGEFNIFKSLNIIHHVSHKKDKNYMITSTDAERAFDKF